MMKATFQHIIFDLDGTLTDSKQGILNSIAYAANKMGLRIPEGNEMISFIGTPLQDLFYGNFGLNPAETNEAVNHFRKYYSETGLYENFIYPGITDLLKNLTKYSDLYIATSKLEKYALAVLKHFDLLKYFKGFAGADAAGLHADKTELVNKVITANKLRNSGLTVMTGDRFVDVEAAANCGIYSIGVTYGYGSLDEIMSAKPDYIASNAEELSRILLF